MFMAVRGVLLLLCYWLAVGLLGVSILCGALAAPVGVLGGAGLAGLWGVRLVLDALRPVGVCTRVARRRGGAQLQVQRVLVSET